MVGKVQGKVSRLSSGLDPQISRDPTPQKVLYAKSAPMSDISWVSQMSQMCLDFVNSVRTFFEDPQNCSKKTAAGQ